MDKLKFEWDSNKSIINIKKHKISFDEAKTIFYDDNARLIYDPDHSENEDRYLLIGLSSKLNLLVVSHCLRTKNDIIRIISARKATKNESIQYWRCLQ
jgi:uncharacterized protein